MWRWNAIKKIIIIKNLGFKMEDLQSNNKLQEIMSKLAIFKSDTQKVISGQELSRNKPNIDDDIIDK